MLPQFYDILDLIWAGIVGANVGAALCFAANRYDDWRNK